MTDHTVVGRDIHGAEIRINSRVRIAHPEAEAHLRGDKATVVSSHAPHVFETLTAPVRGEWVRLDNERIAPCGALEVI